MRTEAETRKKGREEEKKMADYQYHTMQPLQPSDDFEDEDINVNVESENEGTLFYLKTSKFRPRLCVLNFVL